MDVVRMEDTKIPSHRPPVLDHVEQHRRRSDFLQTDVLAPVLEPVPGAAALPVPPDTAMLVADVRRAPACLDRFLARIAPGAAELVDARSLRGQRLAHHSAVVDKVLPGEVPALAISSVPHTVL